MKQVIIDKKKQFTPRRVIWRNAKFSFVYTDHLPIEITLSGMPRRSSMTLKSSTYNIGKPGGWKAYKEMTDKAAKSIEEIVLNDELCIDEVVEKIDSIDKQIKFGAFGKTRVSRNKSKAGNVINEELLKKQSKKIWEEILKLKAQNLGRVGSVFKMKELINGPKKSGQEPTAIRDPKTGDLVVSNEEIKKVTLAYCVDNLSKKS